MLIKAVFAAAVFVLSQSARSAANGDYQVRYAPESAELYVKACFAPSEGLRLRAAHDDAARWLTFLEVNGRERRVSRSRSSIWIPADDRRRCVRYGVNLNVPTDGQNLSDGYKADGVHVAWSGVWLWRPPQVSGFTLTIRHPPGQHVSAPWQRLEQREAYSRFVLDGTPPGWSNLIAFGDFDQVTLETDVGALRLALISTERQIPRSLIEPWMRSTVEAIGSVYGALPLNAPQVLIAPISRGDGPVPWGQVKRGGGSSVHLFINPELPLETFLEDWTAAHEFSHLFHPFFGREGRWLGEGLASYYQNIARARTGLLSQHDAFAKLEGGFLRGRADTGRMTLRSANERMHEAGKYMRVYWSGAAYALLTDTELRRRGQGSLDEALARFQTCHLPAQHMWSVRDFLAELDRLMETDVFIKHYHALIDQRRFPDVGPAYEWLGIDRDGGELSYLPDRAAMRDALMMRGRIDPAECALS